MRRTPADAGERRPDGAGAGHPGAAEGRSPGAARRAPTKAPRPTRADGAGPVPGPRPRPARTDGSGATGGTRPRPTRRPTSTRKPPPRAAAARGRGRTAPPPRRTVRSLFAIPAGTGATLRAAAPALLALATLAVFTVGLSAWYIRSQETPKTLTAAPGQQAAVTALQQGPNGPSTVQVAQPAAAPQQQAPPAVNVAPLKRVYLPDALVALKTPPTSSQLKAVQSIKGVQGTVSVAAGRTTFDGRSVNAFAVDPSSFRPFTPQPTAASDGLWQAVARGELVASYELDKAKKLPLGQQVPFAGQNVRLGALAEFSLPGVDVVVDRSHARAADLTGSALLISAPSGTQESLKRDISSALGGDVTVKMLRPTFTIPASFDVGGARSNAPSTLRELYQRAATTCPGLPWGVLAGIGQVETNHGQNTAVSSAGAMGPMQFIPSTWQIYGVDGDGDGVANILDQVDAVYSAARYLCAAGGGNPDTLYDAIFAYNHADWYVREVLSLAAQYR